jgi:hypothetical protein
MQNHAEFEIVRYFILTTIHLRNTGLEKCIISASFKVFIDSHQQFRGGFWAKAYHLRDLNKTFSPTRSNERALLIRSRFEQE